MTNEQLDELERLEKAATAGPWDMSGGELYGADESRVAALNVWGRDDAEQDANGALIAAMRNALPDLIAAARQSNVRASLIEAMRNRERAELDALAELDEVTADLLATRRALKRAQAKALGRLAHVYWISAVNVHVSRARRDKCMRARALCIYYARKFEREAEEL